MNSIVAIFVSGGGGAVLGAFISGVFRSSLNRASAASMLSDALVNYGNEARETRTEMKKLRAAIINLTDAVDEAIPLITGDSAMRAKLRLVNNAAKEAV